MTLILKPQDEKLVIGFAFRYAFGGFTLGQHAMGDFVRKNWASFGEHTKTVLRQTAESYRESIESFDIHDRDDEKYWLDLLKFMMEN